MQRAGTRGGLSIRGGRSRERARIVAMVLVRKIDAEHPTLFRDESDAALTKGTAYAEALRGLLNSGYRRRRKVSICVGNGAGMACRDFSTFAAQPRRSSSSCGTPTSSTSNSLPAGRLDTQRVRRGG